MAVHVCPDCEMAMEVSHFEDVMIDVCPSCRGVWLDRGELQKIIAHVRRQESEDRSLLETHPERGASPPPPRSAEPDRRQAKRKKKWQSGFFDLLEEMIDFD